MLKYFFFMLLSVVATTACKNSQTATSGAVQTFGTTVNPKGAISYDALLTKMASVDSLNAKVTGKVSAVCKAKGCWMTMISEKPGQPDMRVTFKDYAFFMPKDIVGKTVVIDGFALVETTSVADQRHYAEDAGQSKEEIAKITTPKREMTFEAAGVVIK
ncbi:MAG: hypothetical protein RIR11_3341 [Bacteroidota bacterium]|jgi:hypothetical protein